MSKRDTVLENQSCQQDYNTATTQHLAFSFTGACFLHFIIFIHAPPTPSIVRVRNEQRFCICTHLHSSKGPLHQSSRRRIVPDKAADRDRFWPFFSRSFRSVAFRCQRARGGGGGGMTIDHSRGPRDKLPPAAHTDCSYCSCRSCWYE